jgi:hypothetical protein
LLGSESDLTVCEARVTQNPQSVAWVGGAVENARFRSNEAPKMSNSSETIQLLYDHRMFTHADAKALRQLTLWTRSLTAIVVAFVLVLGTSHARASPQAIASDSSVGDWVYVDHDLAGTRYSGLQQITAKNVSRLVKACAYSFPDKEPSQTAPIVSAGRIYLTTAHYTVAVDGADCHVIWSSTW